MVSYYIRINEVEVLQHLDIYITKEYLQCECFWKVFFFTDFVVKPLSCQQKSAIALSHAACAPNMYLWEVHAPKYPPYRWNSNRLLFHLSASCSAKNQQLRVMRQVKTLTDIIIIIIIVLATHRLTNIYYIHRTKIGRYQKKVTSWGNPWKTDLHSGDCIFWSTSF